MYVTGLVLAAGTSSRLGRPKQTLFVGGVPILGASLDVARAYGFDQLLVTLGRASDEIMNTVDLTGAEVVYNEDYATGCSSSITRAVTAVHPASAGIVLLLGDQPGIRPETIAALVSEAKDADLGVCRYQDGRGHPLWLSRSVFGELSTLHGDKAVWKLLDSPTLTVAEAKIAARIPLDVDTWDDYDRLLAHDRETP